MLVMVVGPDFFVIGAQKAGTTRLCGLLNTHPAVAIPEKEPNYFHAPLEMAGKQAWYRGLYAPFGADVLKGDGTTYYSMCARYPGTAKRLYEFNPAAKIIYLVRHPLRRLESGWVQVVSVRQGNRALGFDYTVRRTNLLLDPSLYWRQLSEYRRFFADEQIAVFFFEDFVMNERQVAEKCCAFLGVSEPAAIHLDDAVSRNESLGKRQRLLLVDACRAVPGYEKVKAYIPQRVKGVFDTHFTAPIPTTVKWKQATRAWVVAQLREDSRALLKHVGRPGDYWVID